MGLLVFCPSISVAGSRIIPGLNAESLEIMARTIYAEGRGEGEIGMKAIAHVILNRVGKIGKDIAEVCLRPSQFTSWNEGEPYPQVTLENNSRMREAMRIALETMEENVDMTSGSTHYHNKSITPKWAMGKVPIFLYRNHWFYNNIN